MFVAIPWGVVGCGGENSSNRRSTASFQETPPTRNRHRAIQKGRETAAKNDTALRDRFTDTRARTATTRPRPGEGRNGGADTGQDKETWRGAGRYDEARPGEAHDDEAPAGPGPQRRGTDRRGPRRRGRRGPSRARAVTTRPHRAVAATARPPHGRAKAATARPVSRPGEGRNGGADAGQDEEPRPGAGRDDEAWPGEAHDDEAPAEPGENTAGRRGSRRRGPGRARDTTTRP